MTKQNKTELDLNRTKQKQSKTGKKNGGTKKNGRNKHEGENQKKYTHS